MPPHPYECKDDTDAIIRVKKPRSGFLKQGTTDISGQIILNCGHSKRLAASLTSSTQV